MEVNAPLEMGGAGWVHYWDRNYGNKEVYNPEKPNDNIFHPPMSVECICSHCSWARGWDLLPEDRTPLSFECLYIIYNTDTFTMIEETQYNPDKVRSYIHCPHFKSLFSSLPVEDKFRKLVETL